MKIVLRTKADRARVLAALATIPALLSGKTADPTGAAELVARAMGIAAASLVREAFVVKARGGTDSAGESWVPLKESTVKGRRQGTGATGQVEILRDTDRLLASLGPGAVQTSPGQVSVGMNVEYAQFLHEGTKTIPPRRLWPEPKRWPEQWWEEIGEVARQAVVNLVKKLLDARQ